jgi:hypothetical protein
MALPPHWLDEVIAEVLQSGDENQIAQAIANSPQLINAIRAGLKDKPPERTPSGSLICGPGYAQVIRGYVIEAIESAV